MPRCHGPSQSHSTPSGGTRNPCPPRTTCRCRWLTLISELDPWRSVGAGWRHYRPVVTPALWAGPGEGFRETASELFGPSGRTSDLHAGTRPNLNSLLNHLPLGRRRRSSGPFHCSQVWGRGSTAIREATVPGRPPSSRRLLAVLRRVLPTTPERGGGTEAFAYVAEGTPIEVGLKVFALACSSTMELSARLSFFRSQVFYSGFWTADLAVFPQGTASPNPQWKY